MKSIKLKVSGMSCPGCVTSVQKALLSARGVRSAEIDLESDIATVKIDDINMSVDRLVSAVEKAGFEARAMSV